MGLGDGEGGGGVEAAERHCCAGDLVVVFPPIRAEKKSCEVACLIRFFIWRLVLTWHSGRRSLDGRIRARGKDHTMHGSRGPQAHKPGTEPVCSNNPVGIQTCSCVQILHTSKKNSKK